MEIKKTNLSIGIVLAIVIGVAILFVTVISPTGDAVANSDEVQRIMIGMDNWVYSPSYFKVKAGVPVELRLDDSVSGCFRDLIIPELGISKYMKDKNSVIKFTPKEGSYTFACSMYMGQGKIVAV